MSSQGRLDLGREDPQLAALVIIDEHGFGEAELARDRLALGLGHRGAVEEDPERVAAAAAAAAARSERRLTVESESGGPTECGAAVSSWIYGTSLGFA